MDDTTAQFFVMLGSVCDNARLADIPVTVRLADGREISGIPQAPASPALGDDELDNTGYRDELVLDEIRVKTADVRQLTLARDA
ncbi:MAG: hypothetical protein AVDCRST_MAG85-489 [uncultured Solirubrobacteraceae bacterium]|uniref:Uncharacterized protein n=1 Tax=uncultured Solirubrobacteraceae bacterium TaxID=1162706 RepID=A0A6J4RP71_9ACTN|nr:MAG: hypothetical protein AVDCRST_MAG85-489 [uncultured Solirubrobacteraceae bacterium]